MYKLPVTVDLTALFEIVEQGLLWWRQGVVQHRQNPHEDSAVNREFYFSHIMQLGKDGRDLALSWHQAGRNLLSVCERLAGREWEKVTIELDEEQTQQWDQLIAKAVIGQESRLKQLIADGTLRGEPGKTIEEQLSDPYHKRFLAYEAARHYQQSATLLSAVQAILQQRLGDAYYAESLFPLSIDGSPWLEMLKTRKFSLSACGISRGVGLPWYIEGSQHEPSTGNDLYFRWNSADRRLHIWSGQQPRQEVFFNSSSFDDAIWYLTKI